MPYHKPTTWYSPSLTSQVKELSKYKKPLEIADELGVRPNTVRVIRCRLNKRGELPDRQLSFYEAEAKRLSHSIPKSRVPYQIKKIKREIRVVEDFKVKGLFELCEKMELTFAQAERVSRLPVEKQEFLNLHPVLLKRAGQGKIPDLEHYMNMDERMLEIILRP